MRHFKAALACASVSLVETSQRTDPGNVVVSTQACADVGVGGGSGDPPSVG